MKISPNVGKLIDAASSLGAGPVLQAIGKIMPGIGQFVPAAYSAGYAADQILDFLKNQFTNPSERRNIRSLEARAESGNLRPDQKSELAEFEQNRRPSETIGQLARLGAQGAAGLAGAKSGAEMYALEEARKNQQVQQQEEEAAFRREQELARDIERKNAQQKREAYAVRREGREIERHNAYLAKNKGNTNKVPKSSSLKNTPEHFLDALKELDQLINRLP